MTKWVSLGRRPGKGALRGQLIEKLLDLRPRALPGRRSVVLEQHPARALLDARRDEQRQPPRREVLPVRGAAATGGEGARTDAGARAAAHRQQRVDAGLRQTQRARRPITATAGRSPGRRIASSLSAARPHRPGLIRARDHAGGRAAGAEDLDAAAQAVERLHARVVHDARCRCGTASRRSASSAARALKSRSRADRRPAARGARGRGAPPPAASTVRRRARASAAECTAG